MKLDNGTMDGMVVVTDSALVAIVSRERSWMEERPVAGGIILVEVEELGHTETCEEGPNLNLGREIAVDGGNTLGCEKSEVGAKRTNSLLLSLGETRKILHGQHAL